MAETTLKDIYHPNSTNTTINYSFHPIPQILEGQNLIGTFQWFTALFIFLHGLIDSAFIFYAYFLLTIQTLHILTDKELKYINLRHIAIKWILCLCFHEIKRGFIDSLRFNHLIMVLILGFCMAFCAYPSRVLKIVHLRYFSRTQRSRYHDSVMDPTQYDARFYQKVLNSFAVLLINLAKHVTALTVPSHRKNIEEQLKNLNTVVINKKCFWNIYENSSRSKQSDYKDSASLLEYLVSGSQIPIFFNESQRQFRRQNTKSSQLTLADSNMVVKAYGEQCSSILQNGQYKSIKKVRVNYNVVTSELEILDLDFGKIEVSVLEEVTQRDEKVIELGVLTLDKHQQDQYYIKFANRRDMQRFMDSIQQSQDVFAEL